VQISGESVVAGPERGHTEWLNGLPVTGVWRQVFCHEPGDSWRSPEVIRMESTQVELVES